MTSLERKLKSAGITVPELSEKTGIPVSTLYGVRLGGQRLSPERARIVAEALEVSPEELADITGERGSAKERKRREASFRRLEAERNRVRVATPAPVPNTDAPLPGPSDSEVLWLHVHQLERRVDTLERELEVLREKVRR